MSRRLRQNIILALCSVLITLAVLNCALPRIVTISDYPYLTSREGYGLLRVPRQRGVMADAQGSAIPFTINAQGFNAVQDYTTSPQIAVIGDSFIEALQVAPAEAFPDLLPALLPCAPTVYRFGIGGAPLSHYLGLMRQIGQDYHPALYVINVAGNDYIESLKGHEPWGASYYLLQEQDSSFILLPPEPFMADEGGRALDQALPLRRYLNYNLSLAARWRQALYSGHLEPAAARTADPALVYRAVRWTLEALQAEAESQGAGLVLMAGADFAPFAEGVEYLDLSTVIPAGDASYLAPDGGHWNRYGHAVVAAALADYLAADICGEMP
jgi:hypothetical protein